MSRTMHVISGIAPSSGGAGRFLSTLVKQASVRSDVEFTFFEPVRNLRPWSRWLKPSFFLNEACKRLRNRARQIGLLSSQRELLPLLVHFQYLGVTFCQEFIRNSSLPVTLFLLDSSFFCPRSYNHLPGENGPCLRCLGGDWSHAEFNECRSFPVEDEGNVQFLRFLREEAALGSIRFLAQTENQKELALRHFGPQAKVTTVGMWADFDDLEGADMPTPGAGIADIVFHGHAVSAKGVAWAIQLAGFCPEQTFLFPFSRTSTRQFGLEPTDNCLFIPMSWETGLRDAVVGSSLTLCPSLWSAPVEGVLVKSIALAAHVGTVRVHGAFAEEVPNDVVLHLDIRPQDAARQVREFIRSSSLDRSAQNRWIGSFAQRNRQILSHIVNAVGRVDRC